MESGGNTDATGQELRELQDKLEKLLRENNRKSKQIEEMKQ